MTPTEVHSSKAANPEQMEKQTRAHVHHIYRFVHQFTRKLPDIRKSKPVWVNIPKNLLLYGVITYGYVLFGILGNTELK